MPVASWALPLGRDHILARHGMTTVQCGKARGLMSALGPEADIGLALVDVRFTPKSGHGSARCTKRRREFTRNGSGATMLRVSRSAGYNAEVDYNLVRSLFWRG
jgi:hypothetical protein